MTATSGKAHFTELHTVAVPVADQERALEFYVGTLGLETRLDVPFGPGARWIEVAPPGSRTTLALPPLGSVEPGVDTGIRVATTDADAAHAAPGAAGVDIDAGEGVPPMFSLRDPDGNTLYVVQV